MSIYWHLFLAGTCIRHYKTRMGMLDYYEPNPELICPRCDRALSDWQGKDGESALLVWKQAVRHTAGQDVPDDDI